MQNVVYKAYSGRVIDLADNPWKWIEEGIQNSPHFSSREIAILRLRFGLWDGKLRTLEEIGDLFELRRERIGQIVNKAIDSINPEWRTHAVLHDGNMAPSPHPSRRKRP